MKLPMIYSAEVLTIDLGKEAGRIASVIRDCMKNQLKRRGIVIGLSGGIDSSVTAALAVKALGKERVFALEMPELHSATETTDFSRAMIDHLGVESMRINISPILEALGFYHLYDDAVKKVIPEYSSGWKSKIVTSNIFENQGFSMMSVVARATGWGYNNGPSSTQAVP